MLHILFGILKIIGIIFLVLISLVILIIAAVLFVPIRYRIDAKYYKNLDIKVRITYLLHLISVKYSNRDKDGVCIKIFGIKTHFLNKEQKDKEKELEKDTKMFEKMSSEIRGSMTDMPEVYNKLKKIDEERDRLAANKDTDRSDTSLNEKNDDIQNSYEKMKLDYDYSENGNNSDADDGNTDTVLDNEENKKLFARIFMKIRKIIHKIKYRFIKFCDTIKKIFKNINDLKDFISDDRTKEAFSFVKEEIKILLKHIRPRYIKGFIHFGFDDPAYTGELLGLIHMFIKGGSKDFHINADFENRILEGEIYAKGRIQCYLLLIIGIRFYKNENLRLVLERRRTNGRE